MITAVVQIGNSDDKLTQQEWAQFIRNMGRVIRIFQTHFSGFSLPDAAWQNACWVVEVPNAAQLQQLRLDLAELCRKYRQDSIALTVGETEFVTGDDE